MYSRVVFVNPAVDKLGIFKRRRVKFHDSFVLVFSDACHSRIRSGTNQLVGEGMTRSCRRLPKHLRFLETLCLWLVSSNSVIFHG